MKSGLGARNAGCLEEGLVPEPSELLCKLARTDSPDDQTGARATDGRGSYARSRAAPPGACSRTAIPAAFVAGAAFSILLLMLLSDAYQSRAPMVERWSALRISASAGSLQSGARPGSQAALRGAASGSPQACAQLQQPAPTAAADGPGPALAVAQPQPLRLPWQPLLAEEDVQRSLSYYGTGSRLRSVVAKLMAGQPIKAYTLGGSVTKGQGARTPQAGYAERFFGFLNATWPHAQHVLLNKGIGGTSSGVFSACAEQLVDPQADLVVVEFTVNDKDDLPFSDPQRRGYEQLLRKLQRLPGAPAVVQLHSYAWWRALGDGVKFGLYYRPRTEEQLTLLSHYYDLPSVSVRAGLHRLMQARVPGFQTDRVWDHRAGGATPSGIKLQVAAEEERDLFFYGDRTHPNDRGHQMLAEMLAYLVLRAAEEQRRGPPQGPPVWARRSAEQQRGLGQLPPPMIPGNVAVPTSLCAIQEGFKPMVVNSSGFEWRPERPEEPTFVEQKWGWTGRKPGDWAELQFDSRANPAAAAQAATDAGKAAQREGAAADTADAASAAAKAASGGGSPAEVLLTYLRSYQQMGVAQVKCVAGCTCPTSELDGTWDTKASLLQIHRFKVSQHQRCRVRVRVMSREGDAPSGGHKVTLAGLMVSSFPIRLTTYADQAEQVASLTRR